LGCVGKGSARTEDTLQGKKFTEEILHGNQEKGCEEEKETLTVLRDDTRNDPRDFTKGLSGEAPPTRLFDFGRCSVVVSNSQGSTVSTSTVISP
jgi:hypothetical protein